VSTNGKATAFNELVLEVPLYHPEANEDIRTAKNSDDITSAISIQVHCMAQEIDITADASSFIFVIHYSLPRDKPIAEKPYRESWRRDLFRWRDRRVKELAIYSCCVKRMRTVNIAIGLIIDHIYI
jgi:hypothetical protein